MEGGNAVRLCFSSHVSHMFITMWGSIRENFYSNVQWRVQIKMNSYYWMTYRRLRNTAQNPVT